jgi:hypothetical protein
VGNVDPGAPTNGQVGQPGDSTVAEGAAVDTAVGLTAISSDPGGGTIAWSIVADDSGGGFKIGSDGVVLVADASLIDYESSGVDRSYDITVRATDAGGGFSDTVFTVDVTNVAPETPADNNPANNAGAISGQVVEGAANDTAVGITVLSTDPGDPATLLKYSILSGTASGGFKIDEDTGVVSVANFTLLDYETALDLGGGLRGHQITVQASDQVGGTSTQTFTIALTNAAPAAPTDTDPVGNAGALDGIVTFDAVAGTLVGVHAQSAGDPAGGTVTYELTDPSGNFEINPNTGEIFLSATGPGNLTLPTYDVSVVAKDAQGAPSGATTFTIRVQGPGPGLPTDADTGTGNQVSEDAIGTPGDFNTSAYTGVDVDSAGATSYSISNDSSGGGFQIDPTTGEIYVANGALIDYESAPGNAYTVTVVASDGSTTNSNDFIITVGDVAPTQPVDQDGSGDNLPTSQGRIGINAALNSNVGITAFSTDVDGGALTYAILSEDGGAVTHFAINASTGVVRLSAAGLTLGLHTIVVQAHSTLGAGGTADSIQTFTIEAVANTPVVDLDANDSSGSTGVDYDATFTEGTAAVSIADIDVTITEAGFTNLASATVTLTNAQLGDALNVGSLVGLGITANTVTGGGEITVTLTGNASFANYQTALQAITFSNSSNTPNTAVAREITVTVNDGTNPSSTAATTTIAVVAANDTPVLNLTLPPGTTYLENAGPTTLVTSGTVTDPDAPVNFSGGSYTVEITDGASAGDQIVLLGASGFSASGLTPGSTISFGGNVIGTIQAASALGSAKVVIGLTADATPTVVNALAAAFGYQSSPSPSTTAAIPAAAR